MAKTLIWQSFLFALLGLVAALPAGAAGVDAALQARVDAQLQVLQGWGRDPAIVAAVKAQNAAPPAAFAEVSQEKWAGLSVLDPFVRGFSKNAVAELIKSKKSAVVSEAFVNAADGRKVAFLSKPSNWSHAGKPKHTGPMGGKTWQGAVEVDESTGVQSIQIAVPVLDGKKAIGSIVVGLAVAKLNQ